MAADFNSYFVIISSCTEIALLSEHPLVVISLSSPIMGHLLTTDHTSDHMQICLKHVLTKCNIKAILVYRHLLIC